ncbi:hypothetical protein CEXT_217501 [Caerostris extrusa]|uniref:Uncharacterized protein n=1 Tax=Caerostris extrusa TaxID=172846 RepID=A0AAV4XQX9_CAEEX|nr:hypothetical protein CEXT_217501 [Caerostris extrusa]
MNSVRRHTITQVYDTLKREPLLVSKSKTKPARPPTHFWRRISAKYDESFQACLAGREGFLQFFYKTGDNDRLRLDDSKRTRLTN